jgi:hypothetical protein
VNAFGDPVALKLRDGAKQMQLQPTGRSGRIDRTAWLRGQREDVVS